MPFNTKHVRLFIGVGLTLAMVSIGCSRQESSSAQLASEASAKAPTCQVGLDAFKTTLHPMLRENCASCHSSEGTSPVHGPLHSSADVEASYRMVLKYLSPVNLKNSRIVTKGGNMHCLDDYGVDCKTTAETILPLVTKWWNSGEKQCPHEFAIQSKELVLPSPLPTKTAGFARMRVNLQDINPAYSGLFFEFEIQRNAAATSEHPGSYLLQRPRFLSNKGNWRIKGLQIALNNEVQPATDLYAGIDHLVLEDNVTAADTPIWPSSVASVQSAIVLEGAEATDKLRIGFGEISKSTDQLECHDLEMFRTQVKPKMEINGCQFCHGGHPDNPGGTPDAKARMSLEGGDEFLCKQFARQGKKKTPLFSPIIWFPMHGAPAHPLVIPFPEVVLPEWGDWLARGSE